MIRYYTMSWGPTSNKYLKKILARSGLTDWQVVRNLTKDSCAGFKMTTICVKLCSTSNSHKIDTNFTVQYENAHTGVRPQVECKRVP